MRIWGYTDPRLLNRKHLLGEHREIHALGHRINGWDRHPEYKRFWLPRSRVSFLILRHELVRVAMVARFGTQHRRTVHATPMRVDLLSKRHFRALYGYTLAVLRPDLVRAQLASAYYPPGSKLETTYWDIWFRTLMRALAFPPCQLEGGADTPWDRDGMSLAAYLALGDDWSREQHHVINQGKGELL